MAAPVISSISPSGPITAPVGSKVVITVVASDPDAKTETLTFTVVDSEGNSSQPATVPISWSDPLTLKATTDGASKITTSGLTATVQG